MQDETILALWGLIEDGGLVPPDRRPSCLRSRLTEMNSYDLLLSLVILLCWCFVIVGH